MSEEQKQEERKPDMNDAARDLLMQRISAAVPKSSYALITFVVMPDVEDNSKFVIHGGGGLNPAIRFNNEADAESMMNVLDSVVTGAMKSLRESAAKQIGAPTEAAPAVEAPAPAAPVEVPVVKAAKSKKTKK